MSTWMGLGLLVSSVALAISPWRAQPVVARSLSAAMLLVAVVVLVRAHGAAPGISLAAAAATASASAVVLARPLVPRAVARTPAVAATIALVAITLEALRGG